MKLKDKFTFGKYKDSTLKEVIEKDAQYVDWCADNIEDFDISLNAQRLLEIQLELQRDDYMDATYEDTF